MKITQHLLLLFALTMGIGLAMAIQTSLNSQLRNVVGSTLNAALISFVIGSCVLAALVLLQTTAKPNLAQLQQVPWYLYLGGCLGVYAISISIYTAPQLGLLTFTGLVIFGQVLSSMLIDHFAWFGLNKTPISITRLLGAIAIFIGVLLTLQR
ncbi:DMT family transporter [Acinetobacter rudis]|uniref:Bacterial/archaeal transporter family-2 protein n=1 Tax=Acinetobacter rudis CIP 110305 TaxID=421052 RepID=S3MUM8_9GAMM|nr:DMT family transporter [Acinetobacter rudis]EPF70263.1 hypothetical protein F945_03282 [Acinetobacter rudis CIP 110305]